VLENNNLEDDINLYNVYGDGYPKFFSDTPDMYFQKGGKWYRETAGTGATQYTLVGNNPHVGPYDGGKEYIAQLENIIPNFSAFTLTATTITTGTTQMFTNYNSGLFNQYSGDTYVGIQNDEGVDLTGVITLDSRVIEDPCPMAEKTECGCDIPEDDDALIIDVSKGDLSVLQEAEECVNLFSSYVYDDPSGIWSFDYILYDQYGDVSDDVKQTPFVSQECCNTVVGGFPYYAEDYSNIGTSEIEWELYNSGFVCCKSPGISEDLGKAGCGCSISCQWLLAGSSIGNMYVDPNDLSVYLKFVDPAGNPRVVNESDSCFCPTNYTTVNVITDPFTGEDGYACRLNELGTERMVTNPSETNTLYQIFKQRATKVIDCKSETPLPIELETKKK